MRLELKRSVNISLLVLSAALAFAQTPENPPPAQPPDSTAPAPAPQPAEKPEFFAGTVTNVDIDRVTVSRTLVGKTPETRTFLIKPETKVGRPLRDKLRVTVRYRHEADGDIALEIRVHSQPRPPKSS